MPAKLVTNDELFDCRDPFIGPLLMQTTYPWEVISRISLLVTSLVEKCPEGFSRWSDNVIIGQNVSIAPTATILGPAVICDNTEILPGAYLRQNVFVGPKCTVGNSSELKNCLLIAHVQVPHYNYVGDSILGTNAHLGAGAICSNLKSDKTNIVVHGEKDFPTGLRKMGAVLGDDAEIGCQCVLNPGTVIGKASSVYPLTSVRGVIPSGCIVKSSDNIILRS